VYTRKGSLGFKIDNRPVPGLIVWRAPTSDELAVALLAVTSNSTLKETRAYLAEHPDKAQELHDMFAE
jgi:hypothetical protein